MNRRSFLALALPLAAAPFALGAPLPPKDGSRRTDPSETCPVCGARVDMASLWLASAQHTDGTTVFFDGPKHLFKYVFELARYSRRRASGAIEAYWVTEQCRMRRIDPQKAFFVVGSDWLGPKGHELVPFSSREEAEEFRREHKGLRVLAFDGVPRDLPWKLDSGTFE